MTSRASDCTFWVTAPGGQTVPAQQLAYSVRLPACLPAHGQYTFQAHQGAGPAAGHPLLAS